MVTTCGEPHQKIDPSCAAILFAPRAHSVPLAQPAQAAYGASCGTSFTVATRRMLVP